MKKLLGILVISLLWCNVAQAKPIDVGNGITLDIPKHYKYFEINYKKLESLLFTFPDLKKQIKVLKKDFKLVGIGNNSKLTILVENQEALELIKKASTPSGLKDIIKEFEDLTASLMYEYMDQKFSYNDRYALSHMSDKEAEKWLEKWWAKSAHVEFKEQLVTKSSERFLEKYKFHKYMLIMTGDKKIDNDTYNEIQALDTNKNIKKEISNYLSKSPMFKDDSTEFNMIEVGKNSNNDLFLYTQFIQKNDPKEKTIIVTEERNNILHNVAKKIKINSDFKYEVLFSSKNEKIIFAGTTCLKSCDDFSKIIYETFEPVGLLTKKNEKKKVKKVEEKVVKEKAKQTDDNNDIVQQLKDLEDMYKSGALTKEEYTKAKKKLLN